MDPCVVCSVAMAQVIVVNAMGHELEFCAHHFAAKEVLLLVEGFTVKEDNRASLVEGSAR